MNGTNGASRTIQIATAEGLAACPLCESLISEEKYETLVRISAARQRQLADERAAIDRERGEVARERNEIASTAAAAEGAKWQVEAARAARDAERLRKQVEAERERLVSAHEKALLAEVHRREAQEKQLADQRAAIERERGEAARERTEIASAAVAAERAKWEAEAGRAARDAERLRKLGEAERERLVRAHERELQAEVRRREIQEKQVALQVAAAQAKAKAEAEARVREAKRASDEQQRAVVGDLRTELKTLEQRRRRDEDVLKETITQLQQKAEARDRAHFGPEGEEDLLQALREAFPGDRIEHRGKGGDVLHTVLDAGRTAGVIVYECKKTKGWQRGYLRQTKLAMETHGTRYGVLVTRALPAGRSGMCVLGGVVVAAPAIATQVVAVLRDGIVALSRLRLSENGKAEKTAALFEYLRGQDFSNAIGRVQEKVAELREGLSRERALHEGSWNAREQHHAALLREAAGIDARVNDLLGGEAPLAIRAKGLVLAGASAR